MRPGQTQSMRATVDISSPSGAEDKPFVIWLLGATDEVEVSLAEQGFFKDVNWLDRARTKLYIIGENLLEHFVPEDAEKAARRLDDTGPSNASVTKEDVASYIVVYSRVFVREQPAVDAKYVGHETALVCLHVLSQISSTGRVLMSAF